MSININEIRETLSINREDIKNNRALTNEYIVEDLMVELGYNKRKNKSVKESPEDKLTWRIYDKADASKRLLAVKVFGLSENFDLSELKNTFKAAHDDGFSVVLVTDGANIDIYKVDENCDAFKVVDINIENELNDTQNEILNAISEESFDISVIDNHVKKSTLTEDEIINLAVQCVGSLVDSICTLNSGIDDNTKEHISEVIKNKLLSKNVDDNSGAISEYKVNEMMRDFREQIENLSSQLASSEDELKTTKKLLKEKEDEINNISGAEEKRARELINVIEDDPEADRSYVAVINKELIQYDDINTFIGRALQKLYEIKHYEASQYIFNTDSLKLISPGTRGDLLMNNKVYDLDLGTTNEDIALNKLRVLFSHFTDIIFECKKLGTLRKKQDETVIAKPVTLNKNSEEHKIEIETSESSGITLEKNEESTNENYIEQTSEDNETTEFDSLNIENDEDEVDDIDIDVDSIEDEQEEKINNAPMENTDDISGMVDEVMDGIFETSEDAEEQDLAELDTEFNSDTELENESDNIDELFESSGSFNDVQIDNNVNTESAIDDTPKQVLLCSQIPQLSILLWSDTNIKFNNIKYIGSSSINLNINSQNDEMTNEQLLCKCIDAAMALAEMNGDSDVIQRLRSTDLSTVSNFVKFYTTEYKDCTKINGTRYIVTGIENIQQTASALADIIDAINIDTSDMFMFIDAETSSNDIIEDWGYEEESIQLREYSEYDNSTDDGSKSVAIIKGNIFSNIMITKNSLKAYRNIIGQTMAVKTNYLKYQIRPESKNNDFSEVIRGIIIESMKTTGNTNVPVENIGNVIGEGYKIVSTDESKVGPEHVQLNANGLIVYVSMVEDWQLPLSIIKTHTTLMNDSNIIVKLQLASNALKFYSDEFETSEPAYMLAVKGLVNYVKSCIKE